MIIKAAQDQAVVEADLALINEFISQCTVEPSDKGIRDQFLEQMPEQNAGLFKHLMQALSETKSDLELKLTGCADDNIEVSQDIQRELWVIVGV